MLQYFEMAQSDTLAPIPACCKGSIRPNLSKTVKVRSKKTSPQAQGNGGRRL